MPLEYLLDGNNEVYVDLTSSGVQLVTTSLVVSSDLSTIDDSDGDGSVDSQDLALWSAAYGENTGGNADLDGDSDGADFLAWQRNYSLSSPLAGVSSSLTVSEPTTVGMCYCGFLAALLGRKRWA